MPAPPNRGDKLPFLQTKMADACVRDVRSGHLERAHISAAQKKRWAQQKKRAAKR